jgi:hypothetical protein
MSEANLNDAVVAADDDLIYADWDGQAEKLVQIMNGHLPVVPGGTLLDASCGSGLEIEDSRGTRSHDLVLHPIAPLELEAAVLSAGLTVTRSSRVAGRAVLAATTG